MTDPQTTEKPLDSTTIILSGLRVTEEAEALAEAVWRVGNRLTEYEKKKPEILEACEDALNNAYARGWRDARI